MLPVFLDSRWTIDEIMGDGFIEVVNRQRRHAMDGGRWGEFARAALEKIGVEDGGATVAFVSDRVMRDLNRRFRGRTGTTDVLSFPAGEAPYLGDVVIGSSAELPSGLRSLCLRKGYLARKAFLISP